MTEPATDALSRRVMGTRGRVRVPRSAVPERAASFLVAMSDGVRLATDVYLPEGWPRAPAVLVRLPYDKAGPLAYMPFIAEYLTQRGYAVVLQDVRGKIRSEGETMAFVHEMLDGRDTVDWVARQPWCSGAVGMYGDSYYGFTQWAAAAARPAALRAIVPRLTGSEVGSVWMYPGGVFRLATMAWWGAYTWVDESLYDVTCDWSVRPFSELVPAWLDGTRSPSLDRWTAGGPRSRLWSRLYGGRDPARELGIPSMSVGGWWDVFQRGAVRDWAAAQRCGRAPQHLLLDAIDHYDDELMEDGGVQPDMYASPEATRAFVPRPLEPAVAFLDRYVKGEQLPPLAAVRWKLVGVGWREADTWPPREARPLILHLGRAGRAGAGPEGGTLSTDRDASPATVSWRHDPADPVPTLDADEWRALLGLPDERAVENRDDVLTFTSEALDRPLDLAGPVGARIAVSSTGPALDVVAKLVDVFPSGRARRIAEGVRRVRSGGDLTNAVVDLGHAGYRLQPGHSLRLEVSSSSFPRYLPHPGMSVDPWTDARTRVNRQMLRAGGEASSYLKLLVLPRP